MSCVNGPLLYRDATICTSHDWACDAAIYIAISGFIKSLREAGAMQQPDQTTNKTKKISEAEPTNARKGTKQKILNIIL